MHPRRLRCSSLKYSRYFSVVAPCRRGGRLAPLGATPDFHHGLLGGEPVVLIEFDFEDDTVHRLGTPGAHVHP